MRYTPPGIRTVGLKKHLNTTAAEHNGLKYRDFETFIKSGVNITNLARIFNVSRPTAAIWLKIYKEEQNIDDQPKS